LNKTIDLKAVTYFLSAVRKEILKGNFKLEPRRDIDIGSRIVTFKQALVDLSIFTIDEVKARILKLDPNECIDISFDYDKRRDFNSEIYEFVTYVNGIKTYIKMTLNEKGVLCLSFHRSKK
jgi:hypothetical protein